MLFRICPSEVLCEKSIEFSFGNSRIAVGRSSKPPARSRRGERRLAEERARKPSVVRPSVNRFLFWFRFQISSL